MCGSRWSVGSFCAAHLRCLSRREKWERIFKYLSSHKVGTAANVRAKYRYINNLSKISDTPCSDTYIGLYVCVCVCEQAWISPVRDGWQDTVNSFTDLQRQTEQPDALLRQQHHSDGHSRQPSHTIKPDNENHLTSHVIIVARPTAQTMSQLQAIISNWSTFTSYATVYSPLQQEQLLSGPDARATFCYHISLLRDQDSSHLPWGSVLLTPT